MSDILNARRITLFLVMLGVLGMFYNFARIKPTPSEAALLDVIADIEGAQPIKNRAKFRTLPCTEEALPKGHSCWSNDVSLRNLKIGKVEFRPQNFGSIIQLDEVGPGCIRLQLIADKYPGGKTENSCSDSYCAYYGIQRSWGHLAFRIPDDSDDKPCVRNVVFNTDYYR